MRKFIFTLLLAVIGSTWIISMASERWCLPSYQTETEPWIVVSGVLVDDAFPCEPEEECPACLTIVLQSDEGQTYYLTAGSTQADEQLDTAHLYANVTIEGVPFTRGSYNYIKVSNIDYILPVTQATKWYGVLYEAYPYWPGFTEPRLSDSNYSLQGDTVISGKSYSKLCAGNGNYVGAIRYSASGRQAYYVPMYNEDYLSQIEKLEIEKDAEYLLYDLNVKVGDTVRAFSSTIRLPCGRESLSDWTVLDVQTINGRIHARVKGGSYDTETEWIEGIGTPYIVWSGERDCQPTDGSTVCPYTLCAADNAGNILYSYNLEHIGVINECPNWSRITPDNPPRLPSLCDTWNVMVVWDPMCDDCEEYHTYRHYLTTDTIIGERHYRKLLVEGEYEGALREGDNKNIYCVPAGTTHEYLLYDFNAKVGDKLENVWLGGSPVDSPDGYVLTVDSVSETTPRIYSLHAEIKFGDEETHTWPIRWIEGVGLSDGPIGAKRCLGCVDSRGYAVLCAYKEGAQVYASELSNEFGCYYDSTEQPADTIPLYAKVGDGPGSSTVDPVDPNEIVATLNGDELIIREYIGAEISFKLSKVSASNQAPARNQLMQSDSFRESVTITLTESGTYELELTNPEWNYSIVGTFVYTPTGVEDTPATVAPVQKVLINGRLLIKHGDKVYTLTGMQVE